jgi:hypothetical protein
VSARSQPLFALLALALGAALIASPARADDGWRGRALPNVGLLVAREEAGSGRPAGTSFGLELSYTLYLGSLVPGTDDRARTLFGSSLEDLTQRLLTFGVGAHVSLEFADVFGSSKGIDMPPHFTLGGHFGGFVGVEADLGLRGAGNGFATTFTPGLGFYLCVGAFSFTLRVPLVSARLSTSAPVFPEPVAFAVKFAPLPVISVIADWRGPFHPEPDDEGEHAEHREP